LRVRAVKFPEAVVNAVEMRVAGPRVILVARDHGFERDDRARVVEIRRELNSER